MKTAISIPDAVYDAAEKICRRKHMSRSEFYVTAINWYIQKENSNGITEQLNNVYALNHDTDNPGELTGIHDLPKNDWA